MVLETPRKRRVGDGTPGPGRPKGLPNRTTQTVRDMITAALEQVGGVDYLAEQARINPTAFLSLVSRVLPLQARMDVGNADGQAFRVDQRAAELTLRIAAALRAPARERTMPEVPAPSADDATLV
jgi:hypothetical protein